MTSQTFTPAPANRRDHYLPRGYLRGFIHPARENHPRPLWHFDIPKAVWSERSPREVGYRFGFYDYTVGAVGLETADSAFADLEREFPRVREALISTEFRKWKRDFLDFLLCYIQMIRARSLLFFERVKEEGKNLRAWTIEEVSPDRRSIKVRSMTPEPLPESFIKNWTITQMRQEIAKGSAWLRDFDWAIRYCESPDLPFVIAEMPIVAYGPRAELTEGIQDPDTLLFFPLCWRACLVGSRRRFDVATDKFGGEDMRRTHRLYRQTAELFLISPTRVELD